MRLAKNLLKPKVRKWMHITATLHNYTIRNALLLFNFLFLLLTTLSTEDTLCSAKSLKVQHPHTLAVVLLRVVNAVHPYTLDEPEEEHADQGKGA